MSVVVEVSARKFSVPHSCACCGATPEVEIPASYTRRTGKRVIHETTRSLDFPYCQRCVAHANKWASAGTVLAALVVVGIGLGIAIGAGANAGAGWAVFVALSILAVVARQRTQSHARQMCTQACAAPQFAVNHLGWSGTVSSFSFQSTAYAVRFADANGRHLINVSMGLRRLLEEHAAQPAIRAEVRRSTPAPGVRIATPVPAPAPRAASDVVLEWIARIEGYKGPEARRNALKRALVEINEPQARRDLMVAASRIEVAAVLDKVDALGSAAAKKRHLQKALADMRADDIADELQTDQLRELEERLRELG